jgi:signal transduction histidine kinase/CheY-like chemotaxis protein
LLEINFGRCSITEEMIAAEEGDVAMGEILTGLLYLHEDMLLREQRQKAAEAALRAAKVQAEVATAMKTAFLAHMSHEVRTPLTALLGFSDLVTDPATSDQLRREYGQIIRRNGEHLLSIINDILDLTKVEAGMLQVERVDCSLIAILADVESLMRVRARQRGLTLSVELATPVPEPIVSDPIRMRQILLNLVGNAIKFTSAGTVRVIVSFVPASSTLRVEVRDDGIGMSPEQLAHVFEPYWQGSSRTSTLYGGSGLGLSISRSLARALGGDVVATSAEGRGSSFVLSLAVTMPAHATFAASLAEVPPLPDSEPAGAKDVEQLEGRVLLAEDGPDNRLLVRTVLEKRGLEVIGVENGRQAVALAREAAARGSPFDVILMDMEMPELDGYAATRLLRDDGYPGPIVALTAHAMAGQAERCLELGCDQFMSKPVDRAALVALVSGYVRRRGADSA